MKIVINQGNYSKLLIACYLMVNPSVNLNNYMQKTEDEIILDLSPEFTPEFLNMLNNAETGPESTEFQKLLVKYTKGALNGKRGSDDIEYARTIELASNYIIAMIHDKTHFWFYEFYRPERKKGKGKRK